MQTPGTVRSLGVLLIALGLILCGSMAYLIHLLQHSGGWHGESEFAHITFSLFYSISAFGGVSFCAGLFQLLTGRRSRVFALLTLGALIPVAYFVARVLAVKPTGG